MYVKRGEDGSAILSKEQFEELQQGYNFIYDNHQRESLQIKRRQPKPKKIEYRYRYRHITVGNGGDAFIFKHALILDRKGVLRPNYDALGELIEQTPNRDYAITKTEALNLIEQLEEVYPDFVKLPLII